MTVILMPLLLKLTRSSAVAEIARRFVTLNISLSHSRSLKIIRNDTLEQVVCKSILVFRWNHICISYRFFRYSE